MKTKEEKEEEEIGPGEWYRWIEFMGNDRIIQDTNSCRARSFPWSVPLHIFSLLPSSSLIIFSTVDFLLLFLMWLRDDWPTDSSNFLNVPLSCHSISWYIQQGRLDLCLNLRIDHLHPKGHSSHRSGSYIESFCPLGENIGVVALIVWSTNRHVTERQKDDFKLDVEAS